MNRLLRGKKYTVRRRLVPLVLIGLVAFAAAAIGADTDRVRVGTPGFNNTRGFSPALYVTVTTVSEYVRTSADARSGLWTGPRCRVSVDRPDLTVNLTVTWGVSFTKSARSAEQAANDELTFEWTPVQRGPVAVPHVVAGRTVGTIPGFGIVTDSQGQTGYHEAGLGLPLGRGVYAGAAWWSRGNALQCEASTTEGVVPVAVWHRRVATRALGGVRLEGNLPPARVSSRIRGRRMTGRVQDSFRHPLARVRVILERRVGSRWRSVRAGRTSASGTYTLRLAGAGRYRVTSALAGTSARSRVFRA